MGEAEVDDLSGEVAKLGASPVDEVMIIDEATGNLVQPQPAVPTEGTTRTTEDDEQPSSSATEVSGDPTPGASGESKDLSANPTPDSSKASLLGDSEDDDDSSRDAPSSLSLIHI